MCKYTIKSLSCSTFDPRMKINNKKISSGTFSAVQKQPGFSCCCSSRDPQAGIQRGLWVNGGRAGAVQGLSIPAVER